MITTMTTSVIIRGLPGSGKTTLARGIADYIRNTCLQEYMRLENDMFRELNEEYVYSKDDYDEVRGKSLTVLKYLQMHNKPVIVSNVFSTRTSVETYTDLLDRYVIVKCIGDYGSIYGVTDSEMDDIRSRWEDVPNEIEFGRDDCIASVVIKIFEENDRGS